MVKRNKVKAIVAALLAALTLATTGVAIAVPVFAQSSQELQGEIDSLEAEQANLKAQQQEVSGRLASLKADKEKQLEYKKALDEQLVSIQSEINVINEKIDTLDEQIRQKQKEIESDEQNITETFAQLKARIHALYLAGEASDLEILLNAKNIADLSEKIEVMKAITAHDSALIDRLKDELNKIKQQKAEIESARQKVVQAKAELEQKQKEVTSLVAESQAVIAEINASEAEASSLKSQLEAEFNATSLSLEQTYKDYYAAKSAEERAAAEKAAAEVKKVTDDDYDTSYTAPPVQTTPSTSNNSSGSSYTPVQSVQGNGVSYGQFIWPTPGTTIITSGVGPRWGRSHNGIDISGGGCYGSPIVASDGGTVIVAVHSGWGGGYGSHVMIDHGNGYTTVYGHASSVIVNVGDKVSQGQTIAYIGSTGDSTGPHLHFEIRQNGAIRDPENYVRA